LHAGKYPARPGPRAHCIGLGCKPVPAPAQRRPACTSCAAHDSPPCVGRRRRCRVMQTACTSNVGTPLGDSMRAQCRRTCGLCSLSGGALCTVTHCGRPLRQAVCAAAAEAWAAVRGAEGLDVLFAGLQARLCGLGWAWPMHGPVDARLHGGLVRAQLRVRPSFGWAHCGAAGAAGLLVCARGLGCRCAGLCKRKRTAARAHVARSAPRRIRGSERKRAPRCAD
jgi:hypothetical protein